MTQIKNRQIIDKGSFFDSLRTVVLKQTINGIVYPVTDRFLSVDHLQLVYLLTYNNTLIV